jgi:NitT/TauT family transport system substrate-binding protein
MKSIRLMLAIICVIASTRSLAAELVVSLWGLGMYGAPMGVALERGFFKEQGIDVTSISGSTGGGTTVRNMLASDVPYGEVAVAAVVAAVQQGIKLTIVNGGVISLEDMVWITRPDSPIKSIQDLKGKTLAYSQPKSVTDMVSILVLEKAGIFGDVKRVAIGGVSNGLVALREGAVDVAFIFEPLYSKKLVEASATTYCFAPPPSCRTSHSRSGWWRPTISAAIPNRSRRSSRRAARAWTTS